MVDSIRIKNILIGNSRIKNWQLFVLIASVYLLVALVTNTFIFSKETYYSLLSDRMETARIDDHLNLVQKLNLIQYLMITPLLWLKISVVALLLQLPLIIKFIHIPFGQLFRIVSFAQIAHVFANIVTIALLISSSPINASVDKLSIIPTSVASFLDKSHYSSPVWNFLNTFNLFEILWCLIICKGVSMTGKIDIESSVILVLLVWISILIVQFVISFYISNIIS